MAYQQPLSLNTMVIAYTNEQIREACEKYNENDITHFLNYLLNNYIGQCGGFTQTEYEEESKWKSLFLFYGNNKIKEKAINVYKTFINNNTVGVYLPKDIQRIIDRAIETTHTRIACHNASELGSEKWLEEIKSESYIKAQSFLERKIADNGLQMSLEQRHKYISNMITNSYGFQLSLDLWLHQYK